MAIDRKVRSRLDEKGGRLPDLMLGAIGEEAQPGAMQQILCILGRSCSPPDPGEHIGPKPFLVHICGHGFPVPRRRCTHDGMLPVGQDSRQRGVRKSYFPNVLARKISPNHEVSMRVAVLFAMISLG